jgi:dihydrodipicolinate reductase
LAEAIPAASVIKFTVDNVVVVLLKLAREDPPVIVSLTGFSKATAPEASRRVTLTAV